MLLNQGESAELAGDRFSGLSPVSYALSVADRENVPYVLVLQGAKLRLYPAQVGVGVGGRGRTETYVEVHAGLLPDVDAAYLWLLFSAEALADGGTLAALLEESKRFAGRLAEQLRQRIYDHVVPRLAEGLAKARGLKKPAPDDLAVTYEMAMTVLFRLLFIAYGEDKDLLPYKWNSLYPARSLKRKAQELQAQIREAIPLGRDRPVDSLEPASLEILFDDDASLWEEIHRLSRAGPRARPSGAFRDISRSTDSRTVRAAMIPASVVIANTAPFLLWPRGDEKDAAYVLGILCSLPLDWYSRRFVETHVNFFVFNPLPIPRPDRANPLWQRVVAVSGRLAAADERFAAWAAAVGVECGALAGEEQFDLISELDAVAAQLYGLEERHLEHVFQTFHETWKPGTTADHPTLGNYNDRWERTREHFRRWGR